MIVLCYLFISATFSQSIRSNRRELFCKKGVLGNLTKFTRKHLWQSLFFNKVAGLQSLFFNKVAGLWHRCFLRTPLLLNCLHLNPIQDRGKQKAPPPTSFSSVTSTNVGNSPKNFLTFSFKPFTVLLSLRAFSWNCIISFVKILVRC